MDRPPFALFGTDTAIQKIRLAEDSWNTRNPDTVVLAYSDDRTWRSRAEFMTGHAEIRAFLTQK